MSTPSQNPWLARLSKIYVVLTFALILIGGMVTTSGAGMAFQTWPLSDGSMNPPGWTEDRAKLLEHSHRLVAELIAATTAVLGAWIWRNGLALLIGPGTGIIAGFIAYKAEMTAANASAIGMAVNVVAFTVALLSRGSPPRSAEQKLVLAAAWLVSIQAVLGGFRVLIEAHVSPGAAVGFRIFHGIVAQVFLVIVVVLAARLSPVWQELGQRPPVARAPKVRRMAIAAMGLYFLQLACAAYLRHHPGDWQVIASWPAAQGSPGLSVSGSWLPAAWSHQAGIHFLHTRVLPFLLLGHLIGMGVGMLKRVEEPRLGRLGLWLIVAVVVQIVLGALMFALIAKAALGHPHPHITNTHVVLGAALIALIALVFARAERLSPAR